MAAAGCNVFMVHARKAWLNGLSPKENRTVPPLQYDWVHRLKMDRPNLEIIINGGVNDLDDVAAQLEHVDGVMVGRAAYSRPASFMHVDQSLYGKSNPCADPYAVLARYMPYVQAELDKGERLHRLIRPILPLFHGLPYTKQWRRFLSEHAWKHEAGYKVLLQACALLDEPSLV